MAANYRDGIEVSYGAAAALERVLPDLAAAAEFERRIAGVSVSSFIDGPAGLRRLPDGTFTDLARADVHGELRRPVCRDVDLDEVRDDRPWGRNESAMAVAAYGPSTAFGTEAVGMYMVVWVADDPSETDMDPFTDGGGSRESGPRPVEHHRTRLRAGGHARRIIEATVARDERGMRVLSWREAR